ncbi:MAG: S8 family serine peptidase [Bacteriovoracaceae bacterium]|nr:S8 family serine peptidase [Bacteriovoracaceae bacterium]
MKFITILFTIMVMVSCAKETAIQPLSLTGDKLISDRPQNYTDVLTIVRLKRPALVATAKITDGKVEIDPREKEAMLKEQKEALEKLKKISPAIKMVYSYRLVMNGIAVIAPVKVFDQIRNLDFVGGVVKESSFARPKAETTIAKEVNGFKGGTSVDFIDATRVHKELNITGKGMRVGIIDTGIDYTHSMFKGSGDPQIFKNIDPDKDYEGFPTAKVVGGIDLVGSNYSPGSGFPGIRFPKPDNNPIDGGGHGTHVAGTVAGHGDGKNTYDGVAPDASLYAIKVFGGGSTGDSVVIAALEYAMDPNQDLDPSDKLDVVNLSLGGGYGKPHIFYNEAVKNLVRGGVIMVASAGNSGHTSYIVGAPSTADEAISVGASIDGMYKNWKFDTVKFNTSDEALYAELVEGAISKPVADSKDVTEALVFAGAAATDFSDELKEKLKGKIALIDRGEVTFTEKLKRAFDAGAIGVIVANNRDGDPIAMGGEGKVEIPAIMVKKAFGDVLKEKMKAGDVVVDFNSDKKIEKPELIDNLTTFSSRGPRSNDSLIKPEIAAPGFQIISASMGGGVKGVPLNGTSMSGPHVAGVMALLKQAKPELNTLELKALLMNGALSIKNSEGKTYPVSMQGAGRVQTFKSATAPVLAMPASLSLGETNLLSGKMFRKSIELKNLTDKEVVLKSTSTSSEGVEVKVQEMVTLAAKETKKVKVEFILKATTNVSAYEEREAVVSFTDNGIELVRIPALAVVRNISKVEAGNLIVHATSMDDAAGAAADIEVFNKSGNRGEVLPFNLLGLDPKKPVNLGDRAVRSRSCDLQAVGYRMIKENGKTFLELGVKLHNPVSRWQACEVSAQIDVDGDGIAEQELGGIDSSNLGGLQAAVGAGYFSVLLDAKKAREIRKKYELEQTRSQGKKGKRPEFTAAVLGLEPMKVWNHSTVAIIKTDVSALKATTSGQWKVKVGVLHEDSAAVESDDFLSIDKSWLEINAESSLQGFVNLPKSIVLGGGQKKTLELEKGSGAHQLLLLMPHNAPVAVDSRSSDTQSKVSGPVFKL